MLQLAVVIVAAHVIVLLYVSVLLVGMLFHICLMHQLVFFTAVSLTNYLVMVIDCGVVQRVICGILKRGRRTILRYTVIENGGETGI